MRFTPFLHALDVFLIPKIARVARLAQPTPLAFRLARLAAGGLATKLLTPRIVRIRHKQLFAVQALTWMTW
jgi:hypothetical protein